MSTLSIAYPIWFIALCVLLGLAYAIGLYFRDVKTGLSAPLKAGLGLLRFLAVTAAAFLLLSPIIRLRSTETEKPVIIFAHDNTSSISNAMDSNALVAYRNELNGLVGDLETDYLVREFAFGEQISEKAEMDFSEEGTNLAACLDDLYDRFTNQHVGAIVLASDGIYNLGANPLYGNRRLNAPVYSLALGDTTVRKDLKISRTRYNKIVYLGDRFNIRADIGALNSAGTNSRLSVRSVNEGGKRVHDQAINVTNERFDQEVEIQLEATQAGIMHYRLSLNPVSDEVTTANNFADVFIEVLDARQKILLLADAPHPDVSAIKRAVELQKNYELEVSYAADFNGSLSGYNMLILHQVPSPRTSAGLLEQIRQSDVPRLFILGESSNLSTFNNLQRVVKLRGSRSSMNAIQSDAAADFKLFELPGNLRTALRKFPPLQSPFADYQLSSGSEMLLKQKIGSVVTEYPLLAFNQSSGLREGVLAAEGIWRWRLYDYLQNNNHDLFDELLWKSVQYLSIKTDKRQFRSLVEKNIYNEKEPVRFQAELYNESYEPVNDVDVTLAIKDEEGRQYDFRFNKQGRGYVLDAGTFPPGNYTYTAATSRNGQNWTNNGRFSIAPLQLEALQTTADHGLLSSLSASSGGQLLYPSEMGQLAAQIRANGEIKPLLHETYRSRPLIHMKWIFWLLTGLLAVEWFIRKFQGAY